MYRERGGGGGLRYVVWGGCVFKRREGRGICSVGRVEEGGDVLKTFYPVILTIHR